MCEPEPESSGCRRARVNRVISCCSAGAGCVRPPSSQSFRPHGPSSFSILHPRSERRHTAPVGGRSCPGADQVNDQRSSSARRPDPGSRPSASVAPVRRNLRRVVRFMDLPPCAALQMRLRVQGAGKSAGARYAPGVPGTCAVDVRLMVARMIMIRQRSPTRSPTNSRSRRLGGRRDDLRHHRGRHDPFPVPVPKGPPRGTAGRGRGAVHVSQRGHSREWRR